MSYKVRSNKSDRSKSTVLKRVLRRTDNRVAINALNELSLIVTHGESVGVIGRNGSGKSTLVRLISGQTQPTKGAVYASNTPIMLGVNAALIPELAGEQNIVLGCLAMGMPRSEIDRKMNSIVELSGLDSAIYLPMKSYSSGMSSRLRFAIAASIDPEILLIDEALNTGDAQFRDRSKERMDELREKAGTVFLVSHSLGTIREMCSRVVWLDKGDLLMDGDPEEVCSAYKAFTWHLTKGHHPYAERLRSEARAKLVATEVWDRLPGRRSA
ncbi:polysaccharide/polyol phosphate ABC transporter ATP-binding protein [Arthrobacter sp. Bz4]|nr:polysaccharide/polyol phosphate ABC transporter ATP-binding protein [Arthrobacter sp. Bz4]